MFGPHSGISDKNFRDDLNPNVYKPNLKTINMKPWSRRIPQTADTYDRYDFLSRDRQSSQTRNNLASASMSVYRTSLMMKSRHSANKFLQASRRFHQSLSKSEHKPETNLKQSLKLSKTKFPKKPPARSSSPTAHNPEPTRTSTLSQWDRLEIYYRYFPVSVIWACCEHDQYHRQLQQGTLKVITSSHPKRCDYKNYERLMRNAKLRGRYIHQERFLPNQNVLLRSISYRPPKRENRKKREKSHQSESSEDGREQSRKKDSAQWRKKATANSKIFIISGHYKDLRNALLQRGWIENPYPKSKLYDLKWTSKIRQIDFDELQPKQLVNHFQSNGCLTTKYGLCKSLRSAIYNHSIDVFSFYPRCYDLSDLSDFENFVQNYKWTYCESILKNYLISPQSFKGSEYKIKLCLMVTQRRMIALPLISDSLCCKQFSVCSPEEWFVLNCKDVTSFSEEIRKMTKKIDSKKKSLYEQVKKLMKRLKDMDPQYDLNGSKNIWIVKPIYLSRGRGIKCFIKLPQILDNTLNKDRQFVVQKYIQNPLIIRNRKFDIRQWVLIEDYNPAKVWFYQQCYLRFCAEEYQMDNVSNKFVHLTNNAIQKYSKEFNNTDIEGNMWTMAEFQTYLKHNAKEKDQNRKEDLEEIQSVEEVEANPWKIIQDKMKQIIINTVLATEELIFSRKNSFELFGYDFMVDQHLQPWLIEVNSSPSMDYSTPVTKRLVKMVLEDCLKVVLDGKKRGRQQRDTGKFNLIHKGKKKSWYFSM